MITALDPASKVAYTFSNAANLTEALTKGWIPILPDGSPAKTYSFEGGYLVDGAPLNAWFEGVWYEGQPEILKPFWDSGQIQKPPDAFFLLPVVPAPPEVVANYAAFKGAPVTVQSLLEAHQQASSGISGLLSNPVVLVGAGLLLLAMFGGSRRGGAPAA